MSTTTTSRASRSPAELPIDVDRLVGEIERYLAARTRTTAHPLVTKSTDALVAEALGALNSPASAPGTAAPKLRAPARVLRVLPDWVLSVPLLKQLHGGHSRRLTAAAHLELTALVIERYGWQHRGLRSKGGRRCILGAQAVLYRLGYGDEAVVHQAAAVLQEVLAQRGIRQHYAEWNDGTGRTEGEVLALVRTAATAAREAGR